MNERKYILSTNVNGKIKFLMNISAKAMFYFNVERVASLKNS